MERFGWEDGLHTFDRTTGKFRRHSYDPAHPNRLSRPPVKNKYVYTPDYISFIMEDASGKVWIGTFEGAISVYDPDTNTCKFYDVHDDHKGNLNGTGYWNALQTSDRTIWIATEGKGVYKVKPYATTVPRVNLHKTVIYIAEDDSENLWIGTQSGLVRKFANGKQETLLFDKDSTNSANVITSLILDKDHVWASSGAGLHDIDPKTIKVKTLRHLPENNASLASNFVNVLEKARAGRLWLGTNDKGVDLFDPKKNIFTHFANNPSDTTSLSNNRVMSIAEDRDKNFWIGTFLGLNKFDSVTQTFKRYLKQLAIITLYQDHRGEFWCGTDAGLFRYDSVNDQFVKFTDKSGLISPTMVIGSMSEDGDDNLWIPTPQKGIVRPDKQREHTLALNENQGVNRQNLFSRGFVMKSGELLFGDTHGY
ncbi:MAG: two-component regulator propeller domain-containing protein [Chryseolinea sp.]